MKLSITNFINSLRGFYSSQIKETVMIFQCDCTSEFEESPDFNRFCIDRDELMKRKTSDFNETIRLIDEWIKPYLRIGVIERPLLGLTASTNMMKYAIRIRFKINEHPMYCCIHDGCYRSITSSMPHDNNFGNLKAVLCPTHAYEKEEFDNYLKNCIISFG